MPTVARRRNHPTRHIALELVAEAARAADTDARVLGFEVRFVVQVAEAQRTGIEAVFVRRGRGGNHCAIQLGMVARGDIKAAITGEHPGLFGNRVKAALHLVLGGRDIAGARHAAEGEAAARRHAALLAVVFVAVLLAAHQQVVPHFGDNFIAADLCPIEHGVIPALNGDGLAAVDGGFSPVGTVTFIFAIGCVDIGKHADTGTFTCTNTYADTASAAAVLAAGLLSVSSPAENDVMPGVQQRVAARFHLASGNNDIAAVRALTFSIRGNGEIVACIQRAARYRIALSVLLRFGFLRGQREADAHRVRVGRQVSRLSRLSGLHTGEHSFSGLKRFEPSVTFLFGILCRRNRIINRAADSARKRQRQPTFLLLEGFIAGTFVVARVDDDAAAAETHVLPGNQVCAADVRLVSGSDNHVTARRSDGAEALALRGARLA